MNGEVTVTFKSISAKEKFLQLNSLQVDTENFALQDVDKPLSFLTIYDAPFDLAIIKRLSPYCISRIELVSRMFVPRDSYFVRQSKK